MIDPQDIDPDTGRPYPNYSSPALDDDYCDHSWVVSDENEEISYCEICGEDGNG